MSIKQTFGSNLRTYRKQMNITLNEMASKMSVTKSLYSKYERGEIELDYAKIILVCQILDITPNDLFEGCNNCNQ